MAKKKRQLLEIDQALADIEEWIENHPRRTEDESKLLDMTGRIISLLLLVPYFESDNEASLGYDRDLLFGFAFFLSKHGDMKYTQSFFNDRTLEFIELKQKVKKMYEKIIIHLNQILDSLDLKLRDYRIQYNDLYVFIYDSSEKRWKAKIKYGNLSNIINTGRPTFQVCQKALLLSINNILYTSDMFTNVDDVVDGLKVILD